jgi:peptidoglycan-associated lipoprotein
MYLKILGVFAGLLLLAACSSALDQSATTAGTAAPAAGVGPRAGSQADLMANIGDRVFFDLNKSDLKPEARTTIQRGSDYLKKYPNLTLTIEEHCDERGTREYNPVLGECRAAAVKNFLTSFGIDRKRVTTISYGKERPAVIASSEAAWAQNRHAVMVID